MLFASSKRALISIETATCLPFSAACTSARTIVGVRARAVERHLDRQHVRVVGGAAQEIQHRRERIVRVVQQRVLLADGGERIVAPRRTPSGTREAKGGSRSSGRLSIAIDISAPRPSGAGDAYTSSSSMLELLDEQAADALGDADGDLEAHAGAEAALPDLAVDDRQQVVRLVLEDVHVHVARDAERIAAEDLHAREEIVEVRGDELLERQELDCVRSAPSPATPSKVAHGTKRGRLSGTLTRANLCSSVSGSRVSTASDSDRFERNGNGWPGSTASGVSTGKTERRKYCRAARRVSASRDFQSRRCIPAPPAPGADRRDSSFDAASTCVRTSVADARELLARRSGRRGSSRCTAASSCSCRPETRIMKNSSRFDEKIARNFRRSSSGQRGLSASASTRSLNASQDISRLK